MRVGVLAAFATLGAVAIGAVYAITVEVGPRPRDVRKLEGQDGAVERNRPVARPTDRRHRSADRDVARRGAELAHPRWARHRHGEERELHRRVGRLLGNGVYGGAGLRRQDFGNVHRAFNPGPGTTEVWAFYVIPKDAGLIIPTTPPACAS
jgi:hypothetical protein